MFMKITPSFITGILNKHLDWSQDKKKFQAWKEGRTGVPFVDANMRELKVSQFQIANKTSFHCLAISECLKILREFLARLTVFPNLNHLAHFFKKLTQSFA